MSVIILISTQLFVMWVGNGRLGYYLVLIPICIGLRELAEWDPNFYRIFNIWRRTKFKTRMDTRRLWGGSHLAALPCGVEREVRDVAGAV